MTKWEALILWLTDEGNRNNAAQPRDQVLQACTRLGLRTGDRLTPAGFRFVLDDRQHQLWSLVLAHLAHAKELSKHLPHKEGYLGALRLILSFSEMKAGDTLHLLSPTAMEKELVRLCLDLGILKGSTLTPAGVALFDREAAQALSRSLVGNAATSQGCGQEEQGIVVESNFKVYAYTSGALHKELLGHFCKIVEQRSPDSLCAHLTVETAMAAMKKGICAANMVRYLESAAHPRALKRLREEGGSIVPPNVRNQLEVWESSRSRTKSTRAVLWEWLPDEWDAEAFEAARARAMELGALLWSSAPGGGEHRFLAAAAPGQQQAAPVGALAVRARDAAEVERAWKRRR